MVPFESLGAVSYSSFMALSCTSSEIKPDIGRRLGGGVSVGILPSRLYGKTGMVRLLGGEK